MSDAQDAMSRFLADQPDQSTAEAMREARAPCKLVRSVSGKGPLLKNVH